MRGSLNILSNCDQIADRARSRIKAAPIRVSCERYHKTMLNEFYRVAFLKKIYRTPEKLQADLDGWMEEYTTSNPRIKATGVMARPPCRRSWIVCRWRRRTSQQRAPGKDLRSVR